MTDVTRRALLKAAAVAAVLRPGAAEAQQGGTPHRIGYLTLPSRESAHGVSDTFELALRGLGWVNGKNVVIDFRFADNDMQRLERLVAGLVESRPAVIVAGANAVVLALKKATRTIPIVTFLAADPVRSGLVTSLAHPGGNITGLTQTAGPEIYGKQLQLLKSAFPKISRIAIVVSRASPVYAGLLREVGIATPALGLQQQIVEIGGPEELEDAFAMLNRRADALRHGGFPVLSTPRAARAARGQDQAAGDVGTARASGGGWVDGLCHRPA